MDTERPQLVYDDDCGFCTWCAAWAVRHGEFDPVGFAELTAEQRARLPTDYEECAHLLTDDAVYSCGEATEEVLARIDEIPIPPELFDFLGGFADYERRREDAYRWVANRRDQWGKVVSADPPVRRE